MPRLFFALQPDARQRQAMADAAQPVLQSLGGVAVEASDLHLTLCFLGDVPEECTAGLVDAAGHMEPKYVRLALKHCDHWHGARILCLLPDTADEAGQQYLAALAAQLHIAAESCGLTPDARPFRPHVTVGRKIAPAAARPLLWPRPCAQLPFAANGFVLMQSARDAVATRYAVRHAWPAIPSP